MKIYLYKTISVATNFFISKNFYPLVPKEYITSFLICSHGGLSITQEINRVTDNNLL